MIQCHMPKDRTTAPMSVFVLSVAYRVYRLGTGAMGARAPSAESSVNCVMLSMQCIARKSNPDSINCVKLRRVINVVDVSSLLTECSVFCLLIGVPCIRPGFPGHVLFFGFCPGVRAGFRKSAVCPGFWPNPQVHSNVANCKGVRRHETKKAR